MFLNFVLLAALNTGAFWSKLLNRIDPSGTPNCGTLTEGYTYTVRWVYRIQCVIGCNTWQQLKTRWLGLNIFYFSHRSLGRYSNLTNHVFFSWVERAHMTHYKLNLFAREHSRLARNRKYGVMSSYTSLCFVWSRVSPGSLTFPIFQVS